MSETRIANFYRLSQGERVRLLAERGHISTTDAAALLSVRPMLSTGAADKMIENVVGVFGLPLAVAPNFLVNGRAYLVPMAVEEPSIVAGVSGVAKLAADHGGFRVISTDPLMIGQVQLIDVEDPDASIHKLYAERDNLLAAANALQPRLEDRGGGARDIEYFKYRLQDGRWTVVLHLHVDTCDAMGANAVNTMCEGLAPDIERISGCKVCLKIISNLPDKAMVNASMRIPAAALARGDLSGEFVRDRVILANEFANTDPYRAATHNKGIMNGIDAVALATGNDWRAVEAGAHAFAVRQGAYRALTTWAANEDGDLTGVLQMPIKVGTVGGSQTSNPAAAVGLRIAGVQSARELAELMGAVGLAQNLAALRALVSDGIQRGHMSLHARSVASSAGADPEIFDQVVAGMIESGDVKPWKAAELIAELGGASPSPTDDGEFVAEGTACGKVILLGEHAAVYDKQVLALPLEAGVVVRVAERDKGIRLVIPDWSIDRDIARDAAGDRGLAGIVNLVARRLGVADRGLYIHVAARIPIAMGLGSSAALAVALIRALSELAGKGLKDVDVEQLAFDCEKISHGTPSGIDNNIATYGQPVLFTKGTRVRTKPLELAEPPPIVIAASGTRGDTRDQVAGVRARYDRNKTLYDTIMNEIDEIAQAGALALAKRDYPQLGALMNVCQGYLNAIEVSTPELERMIALARESGAAGAKLTGAGGGGSIVALCPGRERDVERTLELAGYRIVRMSLNEGSKKSA